jgi:hypothetical protein
MRLSLTFLAVALTSASCGSGDDAARLVTAVVTDSTGVMFVQRCNSHWCSLELVGGDDCGDLAEMMGTRFLLACTGRDGIIYSENCRPLACAEDGDCAQLAGVAYSCRNRMCEVEPWEYEFAAASDDLFALCLRETGRGEFCRRSPFDKPTDPLNLPVTRLVDEHCEATDATCDVIPNECAP